jgi:hypothetical protein
MRFSLPSASSVLPSSRTMSKIRVYLTMWLAALVAVCAGTSLIVGVVTLIITALATSIVGVTISAVAITSGLVTLVGLYIWIT